MGSGRRRLLVGAWVAVSMLVGGVGRAQTFSSGITTGTLQNPALDEVSGITASRLNYGVLWTEEDSGNPAQVHAMTRTGLNLGSYTISGATNVDWEDITVGPGPIAGKQYLYIAEIGDNDAVHSTVSIYRVAEPNVSTAQSAAAFTISGAEKFTFSYSDGPRDAEGFFVDPLTSDIYIVSKRDAVKRVYRATFPQTTVGTTLLTPVTTFTAASVWLQSAAISPDGDEILLRSTGTTSGRLYRRPEGGTIADAFNSTPIMIPLLAETQGEAIAFDPQGWGYYTTTEGAGAPIHYFDRLPAHALWTSTSTGSFTTAGNWDTSIVPNGAFSAHFGATATGTGLTYGVNFGPSQSSNVVIVHRDNVTWNLNGNTYTQTGFSGVDSFIVGGAFGENATLTLSNGTVSTAASSGMYSEIGKGVGAVGVVNIGNNAKWINVPTMLIGKLGSGSLNVNSGATAQLSSLYLGGNTAVAGGSGVLNVAGGTASISGTLKLWNNGTSSVNLSSGSLTVGTLDTNGNPARFTFNGGTLDLNASTLTIGNSNQFTSLTIGTGKTLRVSGASTQLKTSPTGTLNLTSGGLVYGRNIDLTAGTFNFTGGTLHIDNGPLKLGTGANATYGGIIIGTGSLTKSGAGTTTLTQANTFTGSTNVTVGKLILGAPHITSTALNVSDNSIAEMMSGGGQLLRTGTFNTNTAGKIDLNDNQAILDYSGASPIANIRALINTGYNNGSWNGNGITSTSAKTAALGSSRMSIAYAEATSLFTSFPAKFAQQDIDNTTLLLLYTVAGDADMNGVVNIMDFNRLATKFGSSGTWADGDYDYNGTVNIFDFNILATNFGKSTIVTFAIPNELVRAADTTAAIPLPPAVAGGAFTMFMLGFARMILRKVRLSGPNDDCGANA